MPATCGAERITLTMFQEIMSPASITTTLASYRHLHPGDMDRCSPVPDSSQITTVDAPISISESRANPASAPTAPRPPPWPAPALGTGEIPDDEPEMTCSNSGRRSPTATTGNLGPPLTGLIRTAGRRA
jgi:hypothetical protein